MTSSMDTFRGRLVSIDIARGLAMVLMAIDHVRVYSAVPAGGPTPGIFFTRWVTNFCAPAFVFLAGTSAFFHGKKLGDRGKLSRWLALRGAWLVFLELTFLRTAWTFNFDFAHYTLAGVIWMLGWCMILMGLFVRLPIAANAVLGVAIIAGHNLIRLAPPDSIQALLEGNLGWLFRVLYFGGSLTLGGGEEANFFVLYSIIPWIGVMAAGFAFGSVMCMEPARRDKICAAIGGVAIAAFLLLRGFNLYGDRPWTANQGTPSAFAFLNTSKYPASFLFLLMTLGPTIAALPLLERSRGPLARWLCVFGRVPLFYYLLHIPLIHGLALAISLVRTPNATWWLFENHPLKAGPAPEPLPWSLGLLYLVATIAILALYFPCRWFAELKTRRKDAWLSYL